MVGQTLLLPRGIERELKAGLGGIRVRLCLQSLLSSENECIVKCRGGRKLNIGLLFATVLFSDNSLVHRGKALVLGEDCLHQAIFQYCRVFKKRNFDLEDDPHSGQPYVQ